MSETDAITTAAVVVSATMEVFSMLVDAIREAELCGRRTIWLFSTDKGVEFGLDRESFGPVEPFLVIRI